MRHIYHLACAAAPLPVVWLVSLLMAGKQAAALALSSRGCFGIISEVPCSLQGQLQLLLWAMQSFFLISLGSGLALM